MNNKVKKHNHSELPLEKDGADLFLKIISTISVFLFTITLTGYFMVNSLVNNWDKSIVDGFTIQVMPDEKDVTQTELRVNKVIVFFESLEEIEKVRLVGEKQIHKLMKPWLGDNVELSDLPMPKLVDVRLKKGFKSDFSKIAANLAEIAPYTSVNSHQVWLNKLLNFAKSIKILTCGILILVFLSCTFSIFYATKTSLGIHKNIIEILHVMGATDDYIAKQYARRSFFIGLFSGIIGVFIAALALTFIQSFASELKGGIFDKASLNFGAYISIASIVMFNALILMLTAYYTVKRTLGKIM
ncbi:MAG: FtsX-like permease family protein [Alphaproteobacteria bacterium]|nr:FtsX-like permease family protein [Alphaproteobacteria bacterium]